MYYLVANDDKGCPYIWGFHFKTIEVAKAALLPDTWVIDEDGNRIAEYEAGNTAPNTATVILSNGRAY